MLGGGGTGMCSFCLEDGRVGKHFVGCYFQCLFFHFFHFSFYFSIYIYGMYGLCTVQSVFYTLIFYRVFYCFLLLLFFCSPSLLDGSGEYGVNFMVSLLHIQYSTDTYHLSSVY